jgi:Xylanase inhibitor N-terminal
LVLLRTTYSQHYADLWCGSPTPQRQTVIVDTGSGVTAFPCSECKTCGVPDYHIDLLFDGKASQSYRKLSCNECLKGDCRGNECSMGMSYAEGSSWHAYEVVDHCYIGGLHQHAITADDGNPDDMDPYHAPAYAFDLKFGCQTSITGLFIQQLADGIMGMDVATPAFWWQMYAAGKISRKAFSMCFSRSDHATKEGVVAGAMSMGGTDHRLHESPMIYSKVTSKSMGFFVVMIRKVYLRQGGGGLSAVSTNPKLKVLQLDISESTLNAQRVIVDSGTTDTYFTTRIGSVFSAAYQSMTGKAYDHQTKKFTPAELAAEPTIILQLVGEDALNVVGTYGLAAALDPEHPLDILVAIPPEHYYEYDEDELGYVARFYTDEGSGTVLGANTMMGHELYFDVESNTIGWSESSCDYAAAVAMYDKEKAANGGVTAPTTPPAAAPGADAVPDVPVVPVPGQEPVPSGEDDETNVVIESDDEMMDDSTNDDTDGARIPDDFGGPDEPASAPTVDDNADQKESAVLDFNDLGDGKTNEEQSGSYQYDPPKFCNGLSCQVGILLFVVASIVLAAYGITRRVSRGYDNVAMNGNNKTNYVNEMELQEEEFVNYRDKEFG